MDVDKVPETKASRGFRIFFEERGEVNGRRESLLRVFAARGLSPTKDEHALIAAVTDIAVLDLCIQEAVTAASVGAVIFGTGTSRRRRPAPARAPKPRAAKKPSRRR